jgi:hypothetical protein
LPVPENHPMIGSSWDESACGNPLHETHLPALPEADSARSDQHGDGDSPLPTLRGNLCDSGSSQSGKRAG